MNESEERKALPESLLRRAILRIEDEWGEDSELALELRGWLARASIAAKQSAEPVTLDGKTTIREYCAKAIPDDQCGDDWTRGYEECKRRIGKMFDATPPSPTAVEAPSLREAITQAERSFSGMSYGEDKHPSLHGTGYVKGWGDCLRIFKVAYEAQKVVARAALASPTAGEARDAPDREALRKMLIHAKNMLSEKSWFPAKEAIDAAIAALTGDSKP